VVVLVVLHEIIPAPAHDVVVVHAVSVTCVRQHDQIEILPRLYERVDHHLGVLHRHVVIHLTVHQHELPLQILRVRLVRLGRIVVGGAVLREETLIALAPVVFVVAVVVIA